jgi:predicted metalloprotease with PDZ domain
MVRYEIRPDDLHAHLYRVSLVLDKPAALQRLSLPVWIPGSYLVREFARHLSGLEARQGRRAVPLEQLDKTTWQAQCTGRAALTVSYRVYAFDTSVRAAWLDARRGFFNGTSVFLRAAGREHEAHRVHITGLPRGWQVATALRPAGRGGAAMFSAGSHDELIDHPVELGPFWRRTFTVRGVPHDLVVSGAAEDFDGERLLADTRRICEAEMAFWHGMKEAAGHPPFDRYVFLLNTVEDGYGGLEHRASTALLAARRDLPRLGAQGSSEGYVTLLGLISHEYFHSWNVKRLLPAEFAPYDLARENPTQLLWFFEGFTAYYDDLLLLRAGLVDAPRYLKLLGKAINQVLGTPGRAVQSLAAASFDAWTRFYRPDENTANLTVNYYTKGSLVALALDLTLRRRGRATLDDVMRAVWAAAQARASTANGATSADPVYPVGEADLLAAVARVGGRAAAEHLRTWVHGTADPPWRELLAEAGVSWRHEPAPLAARLGARLSEALKVQAVMHGGAAHAAGLSVNDEVLAADGWRLRKPDDLNERGAGEKAVRLLVSRDGRLQELTLPASRAEGPVALGLEARPGAAPRRRRQAWLGA